MSIYDRRLIERIFILMKDCGMPDKLPSRDLLWDLWFMIQEHAELMGWDDED